MFVLCLQARNLTRHWGGHRAILDGIVKHELFAGTLAGLMRDIQAVFDERSDDPTTVQGTRCGVGFLCKSGRHRSVAWTFILKAVAEAMGARVVICHRERARWHDDFCTGCPQCRVDYAKLRHTIGERIFTMHPPAPPAVVAPSMVLGGSRAAASIFAP